MCRGCTPREPNPSDQVIIFTQTFFGRCLPHQCFCCSRQRLLGWWCLKVECSRECPSKDAKPQCIMAFLGKKFQDAESVASVLCPCRTSNRTKAPEHTRCQDQTAAGSSGSPPTLQAMKVARTLRGRGARSDEQQISQ